MSDNVSYNLGIGISGVQESEATLKKFEKSLEKTAGRFSAISNQMKNTKFGDLDRNITQLEKGGKLSVALTKTMLSNYGQMASVRDLMLKSSKNQLEVETLLGTAAAEQVRSGKAQLAVKTLLKEQEKQAGVAGQKSFESQVKINSAYRERIRLVEKAVAGDKVSESSLRRNLIHLNNMDKAYKKILSTKNASVKARLLEEFKTSYGQSATEDARKGRLSDTVGRGRLAEAKMQEDLMLKQEVLAKKQLDLANKRRVAEISATGAAERHQIKANRNFINESNHINNVIKGKTVASKLTQKSIDNLKLQRAEYATILKIQDASIKKQRLANYEAKHGREVLTAMSSGSASRLITKGQTAVDSNAELIRNKALEKERLANVKIRETRRAVNKKYIETLEAVNAVAKGDERANKITERKIKHLNAILARYKQIEAMDAKSALRAKATADFKAQYGSAALHQARSGKLESFIKSSQIATTQKLNSQLTTTSKLSGNIHQTWRGIAAASGNIWMSWGNFLPMLAGFASFGATVKAFTTNKDFAWQMEQVGVAAEKGADEVAKLKQNVLDLGSQTLMQGPLQISKALKILTQAGLKTEEAFVAMKTVLDLAVVAEISDEDSAQFMAGLRSSFNLNNQDGSLNGKMFADGASQTAKAAAVSQTSIGKMMEALRQSSAEAARFNLTITDTSTMLAALARHNVEGSAAGTAFKRFLSDIAGRTPKSQKALDALGISMYNATGMTKPLTQVIAELQTKLSGMTDQAKQKWLKQMFDERGLKAASILLSMTTHEVKKLHEEVYRGKENFGYAGREAKRLSETTEGAFRSMKASWEGMLVNVGSGTDGRYKELLKDITALGNNKSVQAGLEMIANSFLGVAKMGLMAAKALAPLTPLISGLANSFIAYGAAKLVLSVGNKGLAATTSFLTSVKQKKMVVMLNIARQQKVAIAATNAETMAINSNTAANSNNAKAQSLRAATLAKTTGVMSGLGVAVRGVTAALGWVGIVITAASAAWGVYAAMTTRAEERTTSLREELKAVRLDLASVDDEVYDRFNNFGTGAKIDKDLVIGIDVEAMRKMERDVDTTNQINPIVDSNVAKENLDKIKNVFESHLQEINNLDANSSTEQLEQATMVLERKQSILESQLSDYDKHLAGVGDLSKSDRDLRIQYERDIFNVMSQVTVQRTNLIIKKMREMAVAAYQELSWLSKNFGVASEGNKNLVKYYKDTLAHKEKNNEALTPDERAYATEMRNSGDENKAAILAGGDPSKFFKNPDQKKSFDALYRNNIGDNLKLVDQNPEQAVVSLTSEVDNLAATSKAIMGLVRRQKNDPTLTMDDFLNSAPSLATAASHKELTTLKSQSDLIENFYITRAKNALANKDKESLEFIASDKALDNSAPTAKDGGGKTPKKPKADKPKEVNYLMTEPEVQRSTLKLEEARFNQAKQYNQAIEVRTEQARLFRIEENLGNLDQAKKFELQRVEIEHSAKQLALQKKLVEAKKSEKEIAEAMNNDNMSVKINQERAEAIELINIKIEGQKEIIRLKEEEYQKSRTFEAGVTKSYENMQKQATDYGAMAEQGINAITNGLTNAFEQLALTGKLNFKDMTKSILTDLTKIAMRMAMMKLVSSAMSFMGGGSASAGSSVAGAAASKISYSAKGNAFSTTGLEMFAKGSTFANSIVDRPTMFAHGGGLGVMGEAGPEGIFPLTRMSNGDLGVQVAGGGSGMTVVEVPVVVNVTVNSDGDVQSDVDSEMAKKLGEAIKTTVVTEVTSGARPNGWLRSALQY